MPANVAGPCTQPECPRPAKKCLEDYDQLAKLANGMLKSLEPKKRKAADAESVSSKKKHK